MKNTIGKMRVSQALPFLNHIAAEWGLSLNRVTDWNIAVKILRNSVKNN